MYIALGGCKIVATRSISKVKWDFIATIFSAPQPHCISLIVHHVDQESEKGDS